MVSRTVLPSPSASGSSPRRCAAPPGQSPWSARRGRSAPGRRRARAPGRAGAAAPPTASAQARPPCPRGPVSAITSSTSRGLRVHRGEVRDRLAYADVAVDPGALEHDPDPGAQRLGTIAGVEPEHRRSRPRSAAGSPRGSRPWSSCPRRWAPAARRSRHAETSKSIPRTASKSSYDLRRPRTSIAESFTAR